MARASAHYAELALETECLKQSDPGKMIVLRVFLALSTQTMVGGKRRVRFSICASVDALSVRRCASGDPISRTSSTGCAVSEKQIG